ncbi:ABC transporter permease [Allopusillimonas soli]|uniref:ABC transporter permease n=1 Tax=Allopusillimonas soli TaxID=659016 RepID=A0A853F8T8_9BURK|nr:ABC transporter permease [Allopusillimonas soli]NYT36513.1 ABC transporter permease [Allopusillimonas soli]TEA75016.1 ABC transporter permease [Allopusillimonas soli]
MAVEVTAAAAGALSPTEIRAERREHNRRRRVALALVLPLLVFVFFAFVAPIATMLYRSVYNPSVAELIPDTVHELKRWKGEGVPDDVTYKAMAGELRSLARERKAGILAAAVNRIQPGSSSLINSSARKMRRLDDTQIAEQGAATLHGADPRWEQTGMWLAIKQVGQPFTDTNYLTALDLDRDRDRNIHWRKSARIYLQLYGRTLGIALTITVLCILLGYPLAYYLAHAPRRVAGALMVLVLLPFWTSLLVRTTAWIALLQTHGVLNSFFEAIGLIDAPLEMLYTRMATIIAMTHILLPFMILPLYSVMKSMDESYVRAALSLGSRPWSAFMRVYLPLTLPGLSAGSLLVFIISVGYYITPALVGGTDGQMISNIIAFHMQRSNNWGLAAALGTLLLVLILTLYWVYDRLVGARNIKLG